MQLKEFYDLYAKDVFQRPGHPLRAKYKARRLFRFVCGSIGPPAKIADFGGCYGYCVAEFKKLYEDKYAYRPDAVVYELGADYLKIGPQLFPDINFMHSDRVGCQKYDLVLLCDVVEHVADFDAFLNRIRSCANLVLIWAPIEMSLLRKIAIFLKLHPNFKCGFKHKEGHVNFWGVNKTLKIISKYFKIIKVGYDSHRLMGPEDGLDNVSSGPLKAAVKWLARGLSEPLYVKLLGGHLMILAQSRSPVR
jgi:hypothetical protein